jgi:hypothetical protein
MVNRSKKGYNKEKQARDELKKDGWLITFKSVRYRFGTIDFGPSLFDIVAYKPDKRLYISNKHFGQGNYYQQHQKEIKEFKKQYGFPKESFQLWIWKSPRWEGRGKNKKWNKGEFIKLEL